ncbi:MAG TPA: SDR family oxidoreductase [bacterium]|nr:SDR family oxidoreductase [bacterium]
MKTILLTGATGAIGKAIIKLLNNAGYRIAGQYFTNEDAAEKLKDEFHKIKLYKANLLNINECEKLVDDAEKDFGEINILINNASAIYGAKKFLEINEEAFDNTITINFKSHFFITQKVIKNMLTKKIKGKIINISSISVRYGGGNDTIHYGCAKAALECLTKGLAKQFAPDILVNCVQCGFIDSDFHKKIGRSEDDIKKRIEMIPLKRAGKPEDIAHMIEYLCSEKADFITGQIFTVSGGD